MRFGLAPAANSSAFVRLKKYQIGSVGSFSCLYVACPGSSVTDCERESTEREARHKPLYVGTYLLHDSTDFIQFSRVSAPGSQINYCHRVRVVRKSSLVCTFLWLFYSAHRSMQKTYWPRKGNLRHLDTCTLTE